MSLDAVGIATVGNLNCNEQRRTGTIVERSVSRKMDSEPKQRGA